MERDIRRHRGQWKGCHTFKDVICDGDQGLTTRRDGGLKMGETYYYYYELDGATETHDPSMPSTSACPYLPGQRVNTLQVPVEHPSRQRSASLNSARDAEFRTMNPEDKFVTPRAAPPVPTASSAFRVATAPTAPSLAHKRSARSLSPNPAWAWSPRKLFTRKSSGPSKDSISLSRSSSRSSLNDGSWVSSSVPEDQRSMRSSDGSRSRDISPESLRRFLLSDQTPAAAASAEERPSIIIPEDIAEENEDDDNFATSAATESMPYTVLSPPPTQRTFLPSSASSTTLQQRSSRPQTPVEESELDLELIAAFPPVPTRAPPKLPKLQSPPTIVSNAPGSRFSTDSSIAPSSPVEPRSPESTVSYNDIPSFYHSEADDDEDDEADDHDLTFMPLQGIAISAPADASAATGGADLAPDSFTRGLLAAFSGYSLPEAAVSDCKTIASPSGASASPASADEASRENGVVVQSSPLVTPAGGDAALSNLVHEMGWMADLIGKNSS